MRESPPFWTARRPSLGWVVLLPAGRSARAAAVLGTIREVRLEELIDPVGSRQRDLVTAMITAAVIDGSSKLATARALRAETAASSLGQVLGLEACDEDDLYAAMDWLDCGPVVRRDGGAYLAGDLIRAWHRAIDPHVAMHSFAARRATCRSRKTRGVRS